MIMDFVLGFLKDEKGQPSLARLIPLMFSVALVYEWMYALHTSVPDWRPDYEMLGLIGGSIGFKVWQKKFEGKS